MASNPAGWESQFKNVQAAIRNKPDLLVVFMHWNFIKNEIKCLGVGNELEYDGADEGSELLPDKWNEDRKYPLRYVHNGDLYLFSVVFVDNRVIFNVLKASDTDLFSLAIDFEENVHKLEGKLIDMIPTYEELVHKVKVNLLEGIKNKKSSHASTQTEAKKEPINLLSNRLPDYSGSIGPFPPRHPVFPANYGHSDLYPDLPAGIGGGSIFTPPGLGGNSSRFPLPRYDPIGPPDFDAQFRRPRPDHMRPPDYDDMFM